MYNGHMRCVIIGEASFVNERIVSIRFLSEILILLRKNHPVLGLIFAVFL